MTATTRTSRGEASGTPYFSHCTATLRLQIKILSILAIAFVGGSSSSAWTVTNSSSICSLCFIYQSHVCPGGAGNGCYTSPGAWCNEASWCVNPNSAVTSSMVLGGD